MRLHSERWRVRSEAPLHRGQHVRVTGREGMVLQVEPIEGAASTAGAAARGSPGVLGP